MSEWLKERLRANKLTEEKRLNKQSVKAKELVEKFKKMEIYDKDFDTTLLERNSLQVSKHCALMCVDEIVKGITKANGLSILIAHPSVYGYWKEVKKEIEKL